MKRIVTLVAVAAASLVMASQAHAQFGIVAGLTSSKADMTEAVNDVKNITLYHAGITAKADLGFGFAIQPSLIYQVKGANLGNVKETTSDQLKAGYVELPVSIQWGPDLLAFRPYVFAEPFVGYQISPLSKGNTDFVDAAKEELQKVEYGFGLGGGLEIASHIQISAQWFKNLGTIHGADGKATVDELKNMKNFQGIKVTLGILF